MRKLKLHKREIVKGSWVYESKNLGYLNLKKGDTKLPIEEDLFLDGEGNFYNCIKIGDLIYDVVSYEDGVATLEEELHEDFEGNIVYEASLPIIIRTKSNITNMLLDEESNFKKLKYTEKTLDTLPSKKKLFWLNKLTEAGKVDIVANQTVIVTIDEEENNKQDMKQNELRRYLDLAVYFDMDYEFEDKTTLWETMGIKKGGYLEVVKTLMEYGIFGNDEDYLGLKYTIEAIRNKETNIKAYVEAKIAEVNYFKALQELRASMSEEDFKSFIESMQKNREDSNVEQL